MPFLENSSGLRLHYAYDDFTDPWDTRPTLILQHGNGRSAAFWYAWVPVLARHFRIVRPDMRGIGQSQRVSNPAAEINIEHCLADLVLMIKTLADGAPVHVCGESMGGILGIVLAATHPELVRSLSLVSTPVFISDAMKERYSLGMGSRIEAMRTLGIEQWVRKTTQSARFPPDFDKKAFDWYVSEFSKADAETLVRYSEIVNEANALEWLNKVQCPALALFPTKGPITDSTQEQLLIDNIPNLTVAYLPTAYHMIHMIFPDQCAKLVLDFCESH
jgi:3-oxoadipate enol-lactonase